ncbi:MAG: hypothetical protein GX661_00450, partial [Acholeplasmataceae bacterium]|nr:hypothetical protein [Acholeplasmataceae bacterium]
MRKKFVAFFALVLLVLAMTGCWAGEISVSTEFEADGSGKRVIVLDVMDDTLSTEPITNPDDPDGTEGKGAVLNDKHITGGIPAIQTWLEENAPDFITVEPMKTEGYHRYFTLSYTFENFDDFLTKYKTLVNLSPNMKWDDFDETELPTFTSEGFIKKKVTFKESNAIVNASLDWAIDGIYNDIYDPSDLIGYVEKANISVLANYTITIGGEKYEELQHFDPEAPDEEYTGKVVYVTSDNFTLEAEVMQTGALVGVIV